jgi:transglutaminase-like putative cysteine protease
VHGPLVVGFLGLVVAACSGGWQPVTAADRSTAERTVELLMATGATPAPPITSDEEHADAVAPVLIPKTTILYHDDGQPAMEPRETRYIVSRGRMFMLDGSPQRDLDQPMLRIRPVDGGQDIGFVVRSALTPHDPALQDGVLEIVFPAPAIFQPSIDVRATWVAGRPVDAIVLPRVQTGTITVQIPVRAADLQGPTGAPRPTSVLLEGALLLEHYEPVAPSTFTDANVDTGPDPFPELASLSVGRDCRNSEEAEYLTRVAKAVTTAAPNSYQQVLAINSFVSSKLRYLENPIRRWPRDVLEEGVGDCDDHTVLMVALLRALAIPCRPTRGFLYDFSALAPHTWVEVALHRTDGGLYWFICDPTLVSSATGDNERDIAVQLRSRIHLYPAQPLVALSGLSVHHVTDILLNVALPRHDERRAPADLERFVLEVTDGVARGFGSRAEALARSNLLLGRELPLSPGSSYLIGERTITEGRSSLRTTLGSDERITVELVAVGAGVDLGNDAELEVIEALRASYEQLDWLLFHGLPAHHCLELAYSRDTHSDRLRRVRMTFNRYLTECHLRPLLKRMLKEGLWTDQDAALVDSLHRTSGGTNLYFLQELARRCTTDSAHAP